MWRHSNSRFALSLIELLAAIAILAVLVRLAMPRLTGGSAPAKSAACQTIKGNIEIQVELWRHNSGAWPANDLSNIGGDLDYFPGGVPSCPVDGTAYTIDSAGRVIGHNH
jgi:prepilin-type N-terminal cleavage/methylation domain-containing protein